MAVKVLVVEERDEVRTWLGHHVTAVWPNADIEAYEPAQLDFLLEDFKPRLYNAVILSLRMSEPRGAAEASFRWLERFTSRPDCPPVIVLGLGGDELHAVEAMKLGAADYIPQRLLTSDLFTKALRRAEQKREKAQERALWRGRKIPELDAYKIVRPLARTRHSSVYLALSRELAKPVAVKVMERPGEGDDHRMFQRFEREYSATANIDSPRIARIYEYGSTDDYAYIAMEFFQKGDLKSRLIDPILPRHCVGYLLQMAEALEVIHGAGVLHRDLKPANVMLRDDDSLALIDFGLARFSGGTTRVTHAKEIKGSPYYMSPEQACGDDVDQRTDIYALGTIFFEMLTGGKPYTGTNAIEVLGKHRSAPVPKLPQTLSRYQRLMAKLLAKKPSQRYPTARALIEAIEKDHPYVLKGGGNADTLPEIPIRTA